MRTILRSRKGFSLVEVVTAMLILTTVAVATLRIGVSARTLAPAQMNQGAGANVARTLAESLRESVRQDQWGLLDLPLSLGTNLGNPTNVVVDGVTYVRRYTVTNVNLSGDAGGQDYRRVVITTNP